MQIAIIAAILQTVASQSPLPLPANPAVDCGLDVTRQWSRDYPQCMQSILGNGVIYNEPLVDPGIYGLSVPDMKADNMTYLAHIVQTEIFVDRRRAVLRRDSKVLWLREHTSLEKLLLRPGRVRSVHERHNDGRRSHSFRHLLVSMQNIPFAAYYALL